MDKYTFTDWEQAKERGNKLITKEEDKKIRAEQYRYYWEDEVEPLLEEKKKRFLDSHNKSNDKKGLIDYEIKDIDKLLNSKRLIELYNQTKRTVREKRDYSFIKVRPYYEELSKLKELEEARDKTTIQEQITSLDLRIKYLKKQPRDEKYIFCGCEKYVDRYSGGNQLNIDIHNEYLIWLSVVV